MLALLESQNNLFISDMYPNASSVLCSGYREGSLTPRRAAKRKNIAQSAKIYRGSISQLLGGQRHMLPPVRVKSEQVYKSEDTEMVSCD
jgi:hypothetical protein